MRIRKTPPSAIVRGSSCFDLNRRLATLQSYDSGENWSLLVNGVKEAREVQIAEHTRPLVYHPSEH